MQSGSNFNLFLIPILKTLQEPEVVKGFVEVIEPCQLIANTIKFFYCLINRRERPHEEAHVGRHHSTHAWHSSASYKLVPLNLARRETSSNLGPLSLHPLDHFVIRDVFMKTLFNVIDDGTLGPQQHIFLVGPVELWIGLEFFDQLMGL